MRRLMKGLRRGEKGFTLIELLIVIAILGIIAAVVIPNLTAFFGVGTLNAANTEADNVKVAVYGFYAEKGSWTGVNPVSGAGGYLDYLTGTLKATYAISETDGTITTATPTADGWDVTKIQWNPTKQMWEKK